MLLAALLAPFLNKAFHIDDTLFLRVARQIREDPLRPYDVPYNWSGQPEAMWRAFQHPPLNSYVLAAATAAIGESERFLHLLYGAMALATAWIMFDLARRFCAAPATATAMTVASPAFLIGATSVMADIPMLFFWCLSVSLFVRERGGASSVAAATCALFKYFGLAVAPLLAAYQVTRLRRWSVRLLLWTLPPAALAAWGAYALREGGGFHPLGTVSYSMRWGETGPARWADAIVFLGGTCGWPVLLLPPALRLSGTVWASVVLPLATACCLGFPSFQEYAPTAAPALWILFAAAGVATIAICAESCRSRPDASSLLLGLWFFGTLAFAMFLNWTVAARVILPAVFPAAVLTLRWIEGGRTVGDGFSSARGLSWVWAPSAVLSLSLGLADQALAESARDFAARVQDRPGRLFFVGHWGLQHYLERAGGEALNLSAPDARPGDWIVVPSNNTKVPNVLEIPYEVVSYQSYPNPYVFQTMNFRCEAGFYSSAFGRLPFVPAPERTLGAYFLLRVRSP